MGFEATAAVVGESLFAEAATAVAIDAVAAETAMAIGAESIIGGAALDSAVTFAVADTAAGITAMEIGGAAVASGFSGVLGDAASSVVSDYVVPGSMSTANGTVIASQNAPTVWGGFLTQGPMSVPAGTLVDGVMTTAAITEVPAGAIVGGSVLPTAKAATITVAEIASGVKTGLDVYGAVTKLDSMGKAITAPTGNVIRMGSTPRVEPLTDPKTGEVYTPKIQGVNTPNETPTGNQAIIAGVMLLGLIWVFLKGQDHGL